MRRIKKRNEFDPEKLKKGQLLVVRVPPFYDREYLYEITGAGGKLIRADLYHSPTVKKQWTISDLTLLFANGMIRFAQESDVQRLSASDGRHENQSNEAVLNEAHLSELDSDKAASDKAASGEPAAENKEQ